MPSSVSTVTARRASGRAPLTRPSNSSERGHIILSGTTMWRGSSVPEAASGRSGVKSMKFSGLTIVVSSPRLPSSRATQLPAKPPPRIRVPPRARRSCPVIAPYHRPSWQSRGRALSKRGRSGCGSCSSIRCPTASSSTAASSRACGTAFDDRITALFPLHPKHIDPWRPQLDGLEVVESADLTHLRVPLGERIVRRADIFLDDHVGLSHGRRAHEPPPRLQRRAVGARPSDRVPRHRPGRPPAALERRRPRDGGVALLRPAVRAEAAARGDARRLRGARRDEPPVARLDAVPRRCAPAGRARRRLRRVVGPHGRQGRRLAAPRPLRRAERDHALRPRALPRHRPGADHRDGLAADRRLPPPAAAGGLRGAPAAATTSTRTKPLVLFAGNTPHNAPYEGKLVERLVAWWRSNRPRTSAARSSSARIRATTGSAERFGAAAGVPGVAVQAPSYTDLEDLATLLQHADVVVSNAGTILLEALVNDRPAVCVLFDEGAPEGERWADRNLVGDHYKQLAESARVPPRPRLRRARGGNRPRALDSPASSPPSAARSRARSSAKWTARRASGSSRRSSPSSDDTPKRPSSSTAGWRSTRCTGWRSRSRPALRRRARSCSPPRRLPTCRPCTRRTGRRRHAAGSALPIEVRHVPPGSRRGTAAPGSPRQLRDDPARRDLGPGGADRPVPAGDARALPLPRPAAHRHGCLREHLPAAPRGWPSAPHAASSGRGSTTS